MLGTAYSVAHRTMLCCPRPILLLQVTSYTLYFTPHVLYIMTPDVVLPQANLAPLGGLYMTSYTLYYTPHVHYIMTPAQANLAPLGDITHSLQHQLTHPPKHTLIHLHSTHVSLSPSLSPPLQ